MAARATAGNGRARQKNRMRPAATTFACIAAFQELQIGAAARTFPTGMRPSAMRCLWLTREFPKPAVRGDLVYPLNLIENLAKAGANLTVVGLRQQTDASPATGPAADTLENGVVWRLVHRRAVNRLWSLISPLPGDAYRTGTPEFRAEAAAQLENGDWDAVIVNHICMGWAIRPILDARARTGKRPPIVYVSHNHEISLKPQVARAQKVDPLRKAILMHDAGKFVRLEREMVAASSLLTTITEEDRDLYRAEFPDKRTVCLLPGYDGTIVSRRRISAATPRKCIIFGALLWIAKKQNLVDFLTEADPVFRRENISLDIVGNVEPAFAAEIGGRFASCRVVGRIEDVAPYFAEARIGIMPDQVGGGFKHKNLQYIFNRVPLAIMAGQTMGLPLVAGEDMVVADTYADLTRRIVGLIDDFDRLNAMQDAAFTKCADRFDWAGRGRQFRDELARTIEATASSRRTTAA
jgi:glycosyltransferase involved in cell wall biosynthesis